MLVNAMLIKCMPTDATVDFKLGPRMAHRVCIFALNFLNSWYSGRYMYELPNLLVLYTCVCGTYMYM